MQVKAGQKVKKKWIPLDRQVVTIGIKDKVETIEEAEVIGEVVGMAKGVDVEAEEVDHGEAEASGEDDFHSGIVEVVPRQEVGLVTHKFCCQCPRQIRPRDRFRQSLNQIKSRP